MLATNHQPKAYFIHLVFGEPSNSNNSEIIKSSTCYSSDDIIIHLENDFELFGKFLFVKPHKTNHKTNVRTRWFNKTALEVLGNEFKMPSEIVKEMIERNVITIVTQKPNNIPLLEYKLRSNDQIVAVDWKNEKPILYQKDIKVIYHDDEFLVIDKPSSIPVHPAGRRWDINWW